MCWTWFKTIVHSLKILGAFQKTLRPQVPQTDYGPGTAAMHKVHGGVGGCVRPGFIWAADLPRANLLIGQL